MSEHNHRHDQNRFAVIPTAEKLGANRALSGQGVRIAFLDSGFYPHPDYADRVVGFYDVSGEEKEFGGVAEPQGYHWHGTQTVISCAGNGSLSEGIYSGIASEAELVLVKVSEKGGRIPDKNIRTGLRWVAENHVEYGIRIVNMSLGGDRDLKTEESGINRLSEQLTKEGVVITVAAGNSVESHSIPPASSPFVITVGGYSDENGLNENGFKAYHSNFGKTPDGLIKPEIIAPAMFVAAPIVPDTEDYKSAEMLSWLNGTPDYKLSNMLFEHWHQAKLPEQILYQHERGLMREMIEVEIKKRKLISTHYQHVDGTSFAAPITASVIAQMLEANLSLTPATIKNILVSTASRLSGLPAIRQGYGVLNANLAVEEAMGETHFLKHETVRPPFVATDSIIFTYHNDSATKVSLAGDFNEWSEDTAKFKKRGDGIWNAKIPCLPSGKYLYKFLIDKKLWLEDPNHGFKEEDGFGGFNSILHIA